jgi:glycine cleavage system H protein
MRAAEAGGQSLMVPDDRRYTPEHEWIRLDGEEAVVGITDYAQSQLGDIVYVELPRVGSRVTAMQTFGVVESVKTASDLFSPVTGTVVAVNEALTREPERVNTSPYDEGWMIRVRPDDPAEINRLLTAEQYRAQVGE